ncbi:MAG: HD domain-containing protein [Spirochaetes bacterium]|nr:HD domain-containing protein [Spirochaetota bacterium]
MDINAGELRILFCTDSGFNTQHIEEELRKVDIRYRSRHLRHASPPAEAELAAFNPDIIVANCAPVPRIGMIPRNAARSGGLEVPVVIVGDEAGSDMPKDASGRGSVYHVPPRQLHRLPLTMCYAIGISRERRIRHRAQEALERIRLRNLVILDSAAEGIAGLNRELRFVFINRSGLDMLGYGIRKLVGEPVQSILGMDPAAGPAEVMAGETGNAHSPLKGIRTLYRKDGTPFQAEVTLNPVNDDEKDLLWVLSFNDITARIKAEEEIKKGYETLRKILFDSIHAMSIALEFRDPYTAGHQKRVSELAVTIARSMKQGDSCIEGIYLASIVHDIGKICVPAEILTRPKKLDAIEFEIIKEHSLKGYQILKDVEYPWPIADIVHQHHERMDGSGYPNKLMGDDILMEARILAVADVVEAMASHRPYRPSLGIELALSEIRKGAGTLYDREVASACIDLFHDGYILSE